MNWIPLAKGTLPPTTPHPKILVTNNLPARDAHGHMSHVWLVSMVHHDSTDDSWAAFEGDAKLWGLTHWRYAMPEETAPNGYEARVQKPPLSRNPENVLYMLADTLLQLAEPPIPKCSCCGSTENLHKDRGSGGPYRCNSRDCMVF